MVDSLLYPLRKVIQRMSGSNLEAAQALNELKWFRDATGNFGDSFAISIRDTMDPVEWWLQFGTESPTLRKIATRILSQTTSSSGCERNWSTFALIHTKPRNRLSYARLEKLVYVHYNMRLRMRALQNEDRDILHVDPFDVEFVQGDADPIIDWWSAMETDPPLLDEPGEPPRPSPIISDAIESESQPEDTDSQALERDMIFAPLDSQRVRQVRRRSTSDSPSSQLKGKKKAPSPSPSKAKGKGKGKRPIDPLDAIAEAEEDEEDEPSIHSSSSTEDGGDDDGAGGEETVVPSTPAPTDLWTNEQYFDHTTQDHDHGARTGRTTRVYEKKGRRRGGGPTALQDYHHEMMSSLQEVSESTYSVSSTYSTDDTGTSSWTINKETLMGMWYNGYQDMMTWDHFQIWALETYGVDLSRVCPQDMYEYDGRHSSAF